MNYDFPNSSIIYAGDPLCSWCWGIANELQKLKDSFKYPFHTVMGGLRPGTTEPLGDDERQYIREHWVHVLERSGQPINFSLLDEKVPFVYDTEVPCRAVVAARTIDEKHTLTFFEKVQKGFYQENRDTNELGFYLPILKEMGIDVDQFKQLFESEEMRKQTNDDFLWCRQVGVNSFPTVIFKHQDQYFAISIGYSTFQDMEARVNNILSED